MRGNCIRRLVYWGDLTNRPSDMGLFIELKNIEQVCSLIKLEKKSGLGNEIQALNVMVDLAECTCEKYWTARVLLLSFNGILFIFGFIYFVEVFKFYNNYFRH